MLLNHGYINSFVLVAPAERACSAGVLLIGLVETNHRGNIANETEKSNRFRQFIFKGHRLFPVLVFAVFRLRTALY